MLETRLALPELRLKELVDEVHLMLRLNSEIRRRLELPHGWTELQISLHQSDLKTRDECSERLHAIVARELAPTTT